MKTLALLMTTLFTLSVQAAPVFNIFELGIAPSKTAQYDAVGKHNIQTSIANEQGTLAMYSVKCKSNPNMAYMVELYANDAAPTKPTAPRRIFNTICATRARWLRIKRFMRLRQASWGIRAGCVVAASEAI